MSYFSRKKTEEKKEEKKESFNVNNISDIHNLIDHKIEKDKAPDVKSYDKQYRSSVFKSPVNIEDEEEFKESVEEEDPQVDISKNSLKINYEEKISTINWGRALLYLTVLGIMGIIFFTQYMEASPAFLLLTWLFGTMCFLPLGAIMGWMFLNPDIRVLVWRRLRGKNYGLVHFVHRGGQRMTTRIKNFDDDIIIQDTKMWILQNDGIYYLDKNRNKILHAKIESKHIKTMPANIPVIYLDSDTMIPLTFHTIKSKSNPQEVGSTILGYIYNQLAKALYLKKGLQIFFIIMIVLCVLNLVIGFQLAMWLDEIHNEVPKIKEMMIRLGEILNEYNMTLPNSTINLPGG